MDYFIKRFKEPSSWGGVGLVSAGFAQFFGVSGFEQIGQAVSMAGQQAMAAGGETQGLITAGFTLFGGMAAVFLGENK